MENVASRKYFVGGNWKSNGSTTKITDLIENTYNTTQFDTANVDVVVAPIAIHIASAKALLNKNVQVSAQNMSATGNGAFTGEISGEQLKDFEVNWVLVGHSERRALFQESDAIVASKVARSQELELSAILCIGESLEQREAGETNAVVNAQLAACKDSIKNWDRIVIAYEPIWAIGTGKTATPEIAEEAHLNIRNWLTENTSEETAKSVRVIYGGSANAKNAEDLISQANIDGFLVGGASLKDDIKTIIQTVNAKRVAENTVAQ